MLRLDFCCLQLEKKYLVSILIPCLLQFLVGRNIEKGLYDPNIMKWYNDEEFKTLDSYIKHDRDYNFTYAGLRQVVDKYLVQDRSQRQSF